MKPLQDSKSVLTLLGVLACMCFFASCSNSADGYTGVVVETAGESSPDMLRITTYEAKVALGTDDAQAKSNERPRMKSVLDYSFSLGRHEVTCGEFSALMKNETGLELDCSSGNLPATSVTYYDAVLFANARSKAEKFDTAYTYSGVVLDAQKHCTNLEGLMFHPEVDAYRLPTEAEWVLVAGLHWDASEGWNAENSGFKLHEVCTFPKAGDGPCDMAGNAMEWVNDWLGLFRDTTVSNYVGAPDGGSLGERVVKGGSYRNQASAITLYGRGDIYTVTSSTRADYVGFRLAFGQIPDAVWIGRDGRANMTRIVPIASSSTLRSLTGTYKAKLAFRNDVTRNLAYMDYSNGILSVVEIPDTLDVYHPEISPDGKKVAFCTGLEGAAGKSSLYVRNLNENGTDLVKLDVESAAIPRWRVLENGDTAIVYVTDAGNNKEEASFKSASTWQVKWSNGKFGKPEKLFDGAYHGGISEDNTLAVSGARLLRARVADSGSTVAANARDTVWYGGEQACNASLAKDSSKRTLFLDFGGKTGREFVGEEYGTHERLLVVDSTGSLVQSAPAPAGYSFDHGEWVSGGKNLVVATLANAGGAHQKIVLVNLADSSVVNLVEGDELWHPSLWVNAGPVVQGAVDLDVDSAGVYYLEGGDVGSIIMRYKMELIWLYKDVANVAILGSSRTLTGVIPDKFSEEFFVLNLSNVPNMVISSEFILENYLIPHVKKLKYIIISLDIDLWHKDENSDYNFFYMDYKKIPGYVYDENHNFWKDGYPEGLAERTSESLGMEYYVKDLKMTRGYTYGESGSWEENPSVEFDSTWMSYASDNFYASLSHLRRIIEISENYGIYVIGVVFPQSPNFKNTGSFGKYGILRSEAPALLKKVEELQDSYHNFIFMDENKMGNHDYEDQMAGNRDHLCYLGALQMTARLDSVLKSLEGKWEDF
ncbi:MAG: TIGR02171 family protein [Fibrobacter sp.]|uniref:TIGR02171 family lipoprotein n=1 Tax=Fibrobacter sp. TaxID=35828 RepID=UPI0025C04040|nr:TIGR02171 family protein [Fibrobacter sp.]MBR4785904.1 TIGR02171 family protein [Fibrobacter sp.]